MVKNVARLFVQESEILALTRVNTSAASCNEALNSPMIVPVGWLGPLPRSGNPLQATYILGRCQTSIMCMMVKKYYNTPSTVGYQPDKIYYV